MSDCMKEAVVGMRLTWDEYERWIREKKQGRWARVLSAEPPGRVARRRPRDPLKEDLLLRIDRNRLERERSGRPRPADLTYGGLVRVLGETSPAAAPAAGHAAGSEVAEVSHSDE